MVRVVGAGEGDVVQHVLAVEAEALGDGQEALRPKRALRVHEEGLALPAALIQGELARHAEGVAQLGLARAELAKDLGNGAGLEAAWARPQGWGEPSAARRLAGPSSHNAPPSSLSSSLAPVETEMMSARWRW